MFHDLQFNCGEAAALRDDRAAVYNVLYTNRYMLDPRKFANRTP